VVVVTGLALLPLLHVGASLGWTSFTVHWSTVAGLAAMALLYEWRARLPDIGERRADIDRASGSEHRSDIRYPISDIRSSKSHATAGTEGTG
jgi:hypothetical protein